MSEESAVGFDPEDAEKCVPLVPIPTEMGSTAYHITLTRLLFLRDGGRLAKKAELPE